jgi:thioredoxin-dependent peroxiredoxin
VKISPLLIYGPELVVPVIQVGEPVPDFSGTTGEGAHLEFASYRGRPVVLFFYPKANTSGCTIETRGFAQNYPEFEKAGVAVIGLSVDSVEVQKEFAAKCGVPFPLVADRDKSIAGQFGVLGMFGVAKRVTFFVGPDGRVQEVVEGMLPGPHLRRALERLHGPAAPAP